MNQKNIMTKKIIENNSKIIKNLDMNKMKDYYPLRKKTIKKKLILKVKKN